MEKKSHKLQKFVQVKLTVLRIVSQKVNILTGIEGKICTMAYRSDKIKISKLKSSRFVCFFKNKNTFQIIYVKVNSITFYCAFEKFQL